MKKLLIFDVDGTLCDTDMILTKTWEELFKLYKKPYVPFNPEKIKTYSGPPLEFSIHDAFPEMDEKFIHDEYRARTKKYYDTDLTLFDNVKEVLEYFFNKGYIICTLTAKNLEMTTYSFKKLGIDKYFKEYVTRTNGFKPKPSKEGIEYLLNKYHIDRQDAIMIGDTNADLECAINASIDSVLMTMRERNGINPEFIKYSCNSYKELKELIDKL